MDHQRIVEELRRKYPGCPITCLPTDSPTEIVVEIERTTNPDQSVAIAIIDRSEPHRHERTYEVYEVLEGSLEVYCDEVVTTLWPGEQCSIAPGVVHWAEGQAVRVRVTASPAWSKEDHLLVGS